MEIINFASLNDEKGRYFCNAKGTFFLPLQRFRKKVLIPLLEQKNDPITAAKNKFCSKKKLSTNQTNVMNSFSNR